MASIVTYAKGLRRIDFTGSEGKRPSIRLGRVSMKQAEAFKIRIETILADRLQSQSHSNEIASWLGGLDERMLKKLRRVGLADGVGLTETTLGEFLEKFFSALTGKLPTRTFYGHTRRNLETFFGPARPLRGITAADADQFRA